MMRVGGRAHAHGITFESDIGRYHAADNGQDRFEPFSLRTRHIKARLRKVPLLRAFPAFGKAGSVLFALIAVLLVLEVCAPQLLNAPLDVPDDIFWLLLAAATVFLLLSALLLRGRVRRMLQYHGAEHMAINTYRQGKALTAQNIARADRANVNCGSLFVLVYILMAVPLMFVPYSDYFLLITVGIAFELTALARRAKWLQWLLRFGLMSQRKIWTRPPDAAQIALAQRGLCTLIALTEKENAGI